MGLLAIRRGQWTYDELFEGAEQLNQRIREATPSSALPEEPDEDRLDQLSQAIVEDVLG